MVQAYSRLGHLLSQRGMTVPELGRRLRAQGLRVDLRSLYRLSRARQPLARLDLRLAGAICQVYRIPLGELVAFERTPPPLHQIDPTKQRRMDVLMDKNNDGKLTAAERQELEALAREAQELTLRNARLIAG